MSIVSAKVNEVVSQRWVHWKDKASVVTVVPKPYFNYNDTYLVVFGPGQFQELAWFEEKFKGKVLFKSKKACNINHKGSGPRNTLVIFEMEGHTYGDA